MRSGIPVVHVHPPPLRAGVERSACHLRLCRASTHVYVLPRAPPRRRYAPCSPNKPTHSSSPCATPLGTWSPAAASAIWNTPSRSPTSDDIRKLDDLQAQLHEGPCITAVESPPADGIVLAQDLAEPPDADRWPHFAPHAVAQGYRSLMSTHLSTNGGARAALNLYSHTANTFDESARTTAALFGLQAALLLYGVNHARQLGEAVASRDLIGQAKGILMERFRVNSEQAFQMLVSSSQNTNIKLVDVARWLTETGDPNPDGTSGARPATPDRPTRRRTSR
jgi:hypothetical protein